LWVTIAGMSLGKGKPLFPDIAERHGMRLIGTKVFGSGVVLIHLDAKGKIGRMNSTADDAVFHAQTRRRDNDEGTG
jgi:hypothetical protein